MLVSELVKKANLNSDEDMEHDDVVSFFNDAMSEINMECASNFPFMSTVEDEDYSAFPDKWQIGLLVSFAVGRIKQVDSSQFEYNDAYSQFFGALRRFKIQYVIPEEYKDINGGTSFPAVFLNNPYTWE